jgi:hypothetical protein
MHGKMHTQFCSGNLHVRDLFGNLKGRYGVNTGMNDKEIGCEGVNWIQLAKDSIQ